MSKFSIDVPNGYDPESNMITYDVYDTKEEAIKYAKHLFGADDEGRVLIVTEFELEPDSTEIWDQQQQLDKFTPPEVEDV